MEDITTPAEMFRAFVIERHATGSRFGGDSGRGEGVIRGSFVCNLLLQSPNAQHCEILSLVRSRRQRGKQRNRADQVRRRSL